MKIGKRHRKTLEKILENPIRSDLEWKTIERMLVALGADLSTGRGSRIRIHLNGERAVFHRPHPNKEFDKGALRSLRKFLHRAGVNA